MPLYRETRTTLMLLTVAITLGCLVIFQLGYYHGKDAAYDSMGYIDPVVNVAMDDCNIRMGQVISTMDARLADCYENLNTLEATLDPEYSTDKPTGGTECYK